MTPLRKAVLAALAAAASTPAAYAQTAPSSTPQVLESISVVGSRRVNASATDTPVPIDFIPIGKEAETGAHFDLAQSLT